MVRNWPGSPVSLRLGHGSRPRFDDRGALYFARVFDDGYQETRRETWVLEPGRLSPRRLRPVEAAPTYRLRRVHAPNGVTIKVAIDAGHGGTDGGAQGNGLKEKDITLDVALRLRQLLVLDTQDTRGGGAWNVLMTRSTDVSVSLSQRTNMANAFAAASFTSIHMNSSTATSAHGSETYCLRGQENNASGRYRNRAHAELLAAWQLRDRGVKTAGFFVLRHTNMPAILVEGGFITSVTDAQKLASAAARQRLALGLLWAMQEHHGFARYTPSSQGILRGIVYDAAQGTGRRIAGATVALADGRFVRSDASGNFSFSLPTGTYRYGATAAGFTANERTRTLGAGTTWGSLALTPANVPALTGPAQVQRNANYTLTLRGDRSSLALLLLSTQPGLPLLNLDASGLGTLWPSPSGLVAQLFGFVSGSGSLAATLRAPNAVGQLHLQALVGSGGTYRLSNGLGVAVR